MKSKIELWQGTTTNYPAIKVFSGGEVNVTVSGINPSFPVTILASIRCSDGLMALLLLNNALKELNSELRVTLTLTYMPYARQDRVCHPGEAFSLKVAADLINSCEFYKVCVMDAHSRVTGELLNNYEPINFETVTAPGLYTIASELGLSSVADLVIVAPDAGAKEVARRVANKYQAKGLVLATKKRDQNSVTATNIVGDVEGNDCVIVDDICDGGRTFISLAKKLKAMGAKTVTLLVTNGIFSYGKDVILEGGVDLIHAQYDWSN